MNSYIATILLIGFFCGGLQAHNFEISPEEKFSSTDKIIINFVRKNQQNHSFFESFNIAFELWHGEVYNQNLWCRLADKFFDIASCLKKSESQIVDASWLRLLGPLFERIYYSSVHDKKGIHGNINIKVAQDNKIRFQVIFRRDKKYDEFAWKSVVNDAIYVTENCLNNNKLENISWLQKYVPIIGNTMVDIRDDSGIHGKLEVNVNDTTT